MTSQRVPVRVTSEKHGGAFHSIFLSRHLTSVPSGEVKLAPGAMAMTREDE
ncbi:hypothetical protein KIF59_09710 [Enterobacter cloacae subsp. cloacae]|nr:hypothetical protein [Enterobacter cloacae subsp. cloacae]